MKKVLVLMLALLLVSFAGMAKTNYFDSITVEGTFALTGTSATSFTGTTFAVDMSSTVLIDGATSVDLTSAGHVDLESADIRLGLDADDYMQLVFTNSSCNLAITFPGNTPAVTATATSWDFVGSMALDGTTISTTLQADGLASLNGGIAVDSTNFTVDGSSGTVVTAADIDVKGSDITNTTVGTGLHFAATAAAANTATTFVEISGTTAAHASLAGTDIFLDISPIIGIPTGTTANVHLIDMTFSSPAWATAVTSNLRGIYFAPTISNATLGTNAVNLIEVAAITGDDLVALTAIKIGALIGTGAVENAIIIGDNWDAGLYSGSPITATSTIGGTTLTSTASEGQLIFSGATSATLSTTTAGVGLTLDALDAAAGTGMTYVSITGTVPVHTTNTPASIFLDITPTVGIPTVANTVHLIDMVFTVPDYATAVASTYRGIYFDPTLSNATLGTNNLALIDVAAMGDGDADQNVYVLRVGAMTQEGGETANAIDIGAGWDYALNSASPIVLTGTEGDLDVSDNITAGDVIIDEAAGVVSFTGATSGTISTSTATAGLVLDAADQAPNSAKTYVNITGSTPAHVTGATTTDIFLDVSPTIGIAAGTATANTHLIDLTFTSPVWVTAGATGTVRGIYAAPSIGDATFGTNTVVVMDIAAIAGDAQVSTYGIRMGAMTATAATENAIDIGATWDYGLKTASPVWIADDQAFTLGTTLTTAATKITMEFDKTTTGVGSFQIGTSDAGQVLEASPGAAVMPMSLNIVHSGGDGDMADYIGYYNKINVIGAGDSGLTAAAIATRAYVGDDTAVDAVIDELYGMQPWVMHGGVGAITAMSALSAKCDVSADAFTATTINAAHFHIEGAATVTGQFDGVMVEVYPDVTSLDNGLKVAIDGGAAVTSAIGVSGTATNGIDLSGATLTYDYVFQNGETIDNAVDGTLNIEGTTTVEIDGNLIVEAATNSGAIYVSMYNLVYSEVTSTTICTLPANADIVDIVVVVKTLFNGGTTDLLTVGTEGTADLYVDDLDLSSAAVHRTGDATMPYANLGDVGGTALAIKALYVDASSNANTGAATIYVYWTMGTPGSL